MNKTILTFLIILTIGFQSRGQSIYENKNFYYQVKIPIEWNLVGEIENDSVKSFSNFEWVLPMVISELTGNEIEDSIEIFPYINDEINSIEELLAYEKEKWHPFLLEVDISPVDIDNIREVTLSSKIDSFDHLSKKYLIYNWNLL